MTPRICAYAPCGATYEPAGGALAGRSLYCSRRCADRARYEREKAHPTGPVDRLIDALRAEVRP